MTTWITIHTGSAVVGDGGGRSQESMSVMGEARNVATRLEPLAEPGTVVISESVHRLVQGYFVCESLGRHTIKGLAEPIGLFRVLEHGTARSRIEVAGASGLTPLIGRDLEVSLLLDRWDQAKEGIGQTVLLAGEAGIGKSRLVHVIKERASQDAGDASVPSIVEWRCSPFYQNSSLYPVTEAFERLLSFQPEDSPDEQLNKLVSHLHPLGLCTAELILLFAGLLSIPLDEKRYPPLSLSPQRQKERTFEALVNWIRVCAEKQGLLFIVEDLHWIDASTFEVLGMIVQQGAADRLLCVLTSRPEFSLSGTGWTHLTQVTLNRLNRQQVAEVIRRKSGVPHLPPSLVDQIVSRTDGVPLFVEEFTQMVLEAGILREVDGEITLTSSVLVQSIPATLQDLLMARLDRMGSQREVVQLASALGREFSFDLLRAMSPLDELALRQELAKLVSAEILFLKGRPPHASYLFKHALIQEAAYQSLLKSRRQQFHKTIAQVIEQQFAERAEREPELLAHHYTEAGLIREALVYWEKAGQRGNERSAHTEAIAHLTRGLEFLSLLEQSPDRDFQEFRLQLLLSVAVLSVEGYAAPRLRAIYDRARELCVKLGAREPLIQVTRGIWAWSLIRDELEYGAELAREMTELARAIDDSGYRMEAHFAVGCNAFYRGEFIISRMECELGFKLYTPERGRFQCGYTGQDPGVTNQCYIALALWYLGYPEQAQQRIAQTVALSKKLGHPFSHVFALYHETFLKQQCRQGPETQEGGEALQALAEEQSFPFWIALGMLTRGTGLLLQDSCDEAITWLRNGLNALRQTGAGIVVPHFTLWLAEAYGKAGRFDEAFSTLDDASSLVGHGKELFNEPELHRIRGELLLARSAGSDPAVVANALVCFGKAREAAGRQRSRSLELRTATGLARLLGRQGRREEARETLTPVYEWFTEGFDTADLRDARSLLAALDENHEPSLSGAL